MNVDNTKNIPVLSLCPGSLGLERGVKRVWPGIRTVAYVEIEAFINFNLVAAMEAEKASRTTNQQSLSKMAITGQLHQENSNMNGKNQERLNPAWVAQLMGTTLEQSFFACMATG